MEWTQQAEGVPIESWCRAVDPNALEQAKNIAALPVTFHHVALMPDCHVGYGMPIGGVLACEEAIIPNAVGVDIGCGVHAARTDLPAERMTTDCVRKVLDETRRAIPVGFDHHRTAQEWDGWSAAPRECEPIRLELDSARRQLGTLGGGNHFIEIQAGNDGWTWLMLHSGSRNFGLKIAEHYHRLARRQCERLRIDLVSKDLAWLSADTSEGEEYLAAMEFALRFARENRSLMMRRFAEIVSRVTDCRVTESVNIHHNYCHKEEHFGRVVYVHRKGATSALEGQPGIIPGSMGTPSYIVRGRGNPESFMSCSHGAGRRMGRKQASRTLSREECDRAMKGIVYGRWRRTRKGDLDLSEAPQAYKNIEEVMEAQSDLVEIVTRLHPLGVIKG